MQKILPRYVKTKFFSEPSSNQRLMEWNFFEANKIFKCYRHIEIFKPKLDLGILKIRPIW